MTGASGVPTPLAHPLREEAKGMTECDRNCPDKTSKRPECPCPRECPNHGKCCACIATHWFSLVEPVWCMRGK
jgi:hypothetical protein